MFSINVAVNRQRHCHTIEEAVQEYKKSCEMCCGCPQCLWHSCERCALPTIHRDKVAEIRERGCAI